MEPSPKPSSGGFLMQSINLSNLVGSPKNLEEFSGAVYGRIFTWKGGLSNPTLDIGLGGVIKYPFGMMYGVVQDPSASHSQKFLILTLLNNGLVEDHIVRGDQMHA